MSSYRRSTKGKNFPRNRTTYVLASLEHLKMSSSHRGYTLLADPHNPYFYSLRNRNRQLVGSCEFTKSGRFVAYSLLSKEGKYVSKNVSNPHRNSVGLTTQFLEELAAL